jgi:ribonuclease HI
MNKNRKQLVVYTDGSCVGNGRLGSVGGIGIYFPNSELKNISKIFRLGCCTNQRAELYAILTAIRYVNKHLGLANYQLHIKTDSEYSINSITKWIYGWIRNGWKKRDNTPVMNRELIEKINRYYEKYDITFSHVEAHTNMQDEDSIGNAHADKLARMATKRAQMELKNICIINQNTNVPNKDNDSDILVKLVKYKKR